MRRIQFVVLCAFMLLSSCSNQQEARDSNIIRADRNAVSNQLSDLFKQVELIPLETNDSSLIARITKVKVAGDTLFFFDEKQYALFLFNEKGKYLKTIGRVGQGPGEYTMIYDFAISPEKASIDMLSPYGSIYTYTMNGDFIEQNYLPDDVPNYQRMEYLNSDTIVLWSKAYLDSDGVRLIRKDNKELITSYRKGNLLLDAFPALYSNNGNVYLSSYYDHQTYRITALGLVPEYTWDFGKDTYLLDSTKYTGSSDSYQTEAKELMSLRKSGAIPYIMINRAETADYYHLHIGEKIETKKQRQTRKNFFVHKKSRKSYMFVSDDDHIHLDPLYLEDNYILSEIKYEDIPRYIASELLSEADKAMLRDMTEDENPVIAKLYFKDTK